MPNYRRLYVPGGTFFFTLNLFDRRQDTLVQHVDKLRESWRSVSARWPFETIAGVILPDHLHLVMSLPDGDANYPIRLSLLKQGFTKRLPEDLKSDGRKGERNIWQRRYWEHAIRDEADLKAHVDYIHYNPVKHGYVADVNDWPHSSWHRHKRAYGLEWRSKEITVQVEERSPP